jgi:hypothetical protein
LGFVEDINAAVGWKPHEVAELVRIWWKVRIERWKLIVFGLKD